METKCKVWINVFCYENKLVFPIHISDQKFEDSIDLFQIFYGGKSHYLYIKGFDRFMFHKTKNNNKKYFCKSCLQCFSSKKILTEHKEVCLSINEAQYVRLEKGTIKFKNYFKQILVPFKIYADSECNLKSVKSCEGSYSKKYQDHIVVLLTNLFLLMMNLVSRLLFLETKMLLLDLLVLLTNLFVFIINLVSPFLFLEAKMLLLSL